MNGQGVRPELIYEITAAAVALSVVLGAIILSVISLVIRGQLTDPPGWLQTAVGAVIGFYFARRASSTVESAPRVYNLAPQQVAPPANGGRA